MTDSNNGVSLMQSGDYDGGSFSGDATQRLMAGGIVAPVNTALIPNYANIFEGLKNKAHNSLDGVPYGVPHGRGPNLLMYNTDVVTTAPTSWDLVWNGGADGTGKVSVYDSSIYIADAALHLMKTQPDLGITNPYQLNEPQFDAAIALLEQQRDAGALYWGTYTDQIASYTAGDVTTGTSWQFMANLLQAEDQPIAAVLPDEGSTGWSDTWMIAKNAEASQLHVHVDGPHGVRRGQRPGHGLVRRGSDEPAGVRLRRDDRGRPLRADPRDRRGLLRQDLVLVDAAGRLRRRRRRHDLQGPGRLGRGLDAAPRHLIARRTIQRG